MSISWQTLTSLMASDKLFNSCFFSPST